MLERFGKLSEEQLNVGIAIVGATCAVAVLLFGLLGVTDAAKPVLAAAGIVENGSAGQPTPTVEALSQLPPTWTPRATSTATATPTERPTDTPAPTLTETPGIPTETATPEPDYAATVAAAQSATPVIPPTPVPPVAPPPPVIPTSPPAPPPPAVPTSPPPPPTATPQPLYVLSQLLGGPDCSYTGISGTVYSRDGVPRAGVTVDVFNEFGFRLAPVTNGSGFYEAFLDSKPRGDLAGPWHIQVVENGVKNSNEIVVILSGSCSGSSDITKVVADFYRTQ